MLDQTEPQGVARVETHEERVKHGFEREFAEYVKNEISGYRIGMKDLSDKNFIDDSHDDIEKKIEKKLEHFNALDFNGQVFGVDQKFSLLVARGLVQRRWEK